MPFLKQPDPNDQGPYDPSAEVDLDAAIGRLKEFRSSWNRGDTIDEESGLTADDLDAIVGILPKG